MRACKIWTIIGLTAVISVAAGAAPSVFPTGTTRYDPAKAWNGYVLFGGTDEKTHLIDMDGNEVHRWEYQGFPSEYIDPALAKGERGHLLVQLEASSAPGIGTVPGVKIFSNKSLGEVDWQGRTIWSWGAKAPGGAARQHHDQARLSNGNTLVLSNLAHKVSGFALPQQLDDVIYEVTPAGDVVWRWVASDHLTELGFSAEQLSLIRNAATPDFLHINNMTPVGPNKWFDQGDTRFSPDNILFDSRDANVVAIIDRHSGRIVWRLGPDLAPLVKHVPAPPLPVPAAGQPADQFVGQHDAHLIEPGLPGAGNLLLFDNQGEAGYPASELATVGGSRILEIDPITRKIAWSYTAGDSDQPLWSFYSSFISSARRLPNGNTLIDEGVNGRFFQVTAKGEIVWEYVSPYFARSAAGGAPHPVFANWVYRAQPVPYDWAPPGTPRNERAITPPARDAFHVAPVPER